MKLRFKTLQGKEFDLETSLDDTVAEVKRKVAAVQGFEQDPLSCRLIFSGKVLSNENEKLQDLDIKEDSFLVVMPPKKTYQKASGQSSSTKPAVQEKEAETQEQKMIPSEVVQDRESSTTGATTVTSKARDEAQATSSIQQNSETLSDFVIGSQYETTVKNLMEMGFEEQQVKRALRAAFHNPDRAVEYLFNGIPENLERELGQASLPESTLSQMGHMERTRAQENVTNSSDISTSGSQTMEPQPFNMFEPHRSQTPQQQNTESTGSTGSLDFLTRIPQFNVMRRLIQANPRILQPMLQELAQANPSLLDLIHQNQQEFVRLLNEPSEDSEGLSDEQVQELLNSISGLSEGGNTGEENSGVSYIQVSPEEREQIERLESLVGPMGVSRAAILEAWLACDRNEELAANYILSNLEEYLQEGSAEGERGEQERDRSS
ncbi:hypothetical protein GpartN1_g1523.t1 [Galdieria partita]|uniref:UV excision repair protein RAD23 n=1 Tax=Galdieria partita TaxID=83374 RepID=A0A9C7PU89_9RHOD|nr:hypothetical protein GpartN1_g476.t1 [Galdieria partita]GJQ09732.1 hypothetical protein GpartN1_g1523.t1 [Galdieria partita]